MSEPRDPTTPTEATSAVSGSATSASSARPTTRPARVLTPTQKWLVVVGMLVVALIFVSWIGGRRADATRERALARGVDALAASMAATFVASNSAQARRSVEAIAKSARYTRVVLVDANGGVASTDSLTDGASFGAPSSWPTEVKTERTAAGLRFLRAIAVPGGATQGLLVIEVPFD